MLVGPGTGNDLGCPDEAAYRRLVPAATGRPHGARGETSGTVVLLVILTVAVVLVVVYRSTARPDPPRTVAECREQGGSLEHGRENDRWWCWLDVSRNTDDQELVRYRLSDAP